MDYSEDQIRNFQEEFAKHRISRIIVSVFLVLSACLLVFLLEDWKQSKEMELLFIALYLMLVAIAVVYLIRMSRCPACGSIVSRPFRARFCDQCGVRLRPS